MNNLIFSFIVLASITMIPTVYAQTIQSTSDYIDKDTGSYYVVGEVKNNSTDLISGVRVSATYYDDKGTVVGTEFTYTDPMDIQSGGKAPFELILMKASVPMSEINNYTIQASHQ